MAKEFITVSGVWPGVVTNGAPITVEAIGGGGGGHAGDGNVGTGGGGGAYATDVVPYVSGTPVAVLIGAPGAPGGDGGDTDWDAGTVVAVGGQGGQAGTGGTGGAAADCTPVLGAFSGGDGGGIGANSRAGAGGGGAAGPNGDGEPGGEGGAAPEANGAGGGGAGGGASTAGGASTSADPSGAGGTGQDGTPGGAGVSADGDPGNPGLNGSGGSGGAGGGAVPGGVGGAGGAGIEFDPTHGAGGGAGGGGGQAVTGGAGGTGGLYGGGGGGGGFAGGVGGEGAPGLIVITYEEGGLAIDCDTPPDGVVGVPYSHFFPATGGVEPYSFAITAGALPDGLTLDTATGEVSGTPTTAGVFPFTIEVTDADDDTAEVECSITIEAAPLVIECDNPPDGQQGTPYSHFFPATGGTPPYSFAITAGALPDGLTLNAATGEVSGTPTVPGLFIFTIEVTDADDETADVECSITIETNLAISCNNPPDGFLGVSYSHACPASGGTPPYTFSISFGALPPGLTLNTGTGVISGVPTLKGTYSFTIQVVDALDDEAEAECSITIRAKCLLEDVS